MPTRITLGIEGHSSDGSTKIVVKESFDEVMEKFWPLQTPGSTLQGRENNIFTTMDEKRIMIKTPAILLVEEDIYDAD